MGRGGGATTATFQCELKCLQREERKGCLPPALSGHEREPPFRPNEKTPFRTGISGEKSDHKTAGHVHQQSAVGKSFAETPADHAGEPEARDTSERATARYEPIIQAMHCG